MKLSCVSVSVCCKKLATYKIYNYMLFTHVKINSQIQAIEAEGPHAHAGLHQCLIVTCMHTQHVTSTKTLEASNSIHQ